jgi:hypothetical protein
MTPILIAALHVEGNARQAAGPFRRGARAMLGAVKDASLRFAPRRGDLASGEAIPDDPSARRAQK